MIPLPLIAQLDKVDPSFARDWIITFAALFGLFWMVWNFVQSAKKKPPLQAVVSPDPLQVQEVEKLATKAELDSVARTLESDIAEIHDVIGEERKIARTANGNLHKRIDELVETLAETKGLLSGVKENTDRLLARSMK